MTPTANRVVIVVFDGLRPDMIAGRMPNLEAFAREGVWFREARSVFPSYTRVATTATATGCWPARNGIIGNTFHQPAILAGEPIDTSNFDHLKMLATSDPKGLVHARSLGERLAAAEMRMGAVHCGSTGSAYLINHRVRENGHWTLSAHGAAGTQTPEIFDHPDLPGGPPAMDIPKFDAVDYAKNACIALTRDNPPEVAVVWFPEPDTSFHFRELGSEPTRAVMAAVDRAFGEIVDAVRGGPDGDRAAIIAMSDHGQISTTGLFDIGAEMSADGLPASHRPGEDARIALTRGASGECRMLADDPGLAAAAANWLMGRDEIGMVFARDEIADGIPGAFPHSLANMDHPRAAELVYVMRSSDAPDRYDLPGTSLMTGGVPVGGGMHGGLNRYELNTVLMVSAPGGASGTMTEEPCGLIDIAPTALALLGVPSDGMDGSALDLARVGTGEWEELETNAGHGAFQQAMRLRRAGGRTFVMDGGRAD